MSPAPTPGWEGSSVGGALDPESNVEMLQAKLNAATATNDLNEFRSTAEAKLAAVTAERDFFKDKNFSLESQLVAANKLQEKTQDLLSAALNNKQSRKRSRSRSRDRDRDRRRSRSRSGSRSRSRDRKRDRR